MTVATIDAITPEPLKTARLLRDRLPNFSGHVRLYEVTPPMTSEDLDGNVVSRSYVVVSATNVVFSGPETYIFPATQDGEVTSWGELAGSFQGGLDHEQALRDAGYEIV